ncbi:MAG: DNA polymerase beta superfamily protein [Planctomycetota bacterium]
MSLDLDLCREIVAQHPYPLLFATISGAHLYGFPSPDSDYDLRGVHLLPLPELLSLETPRETVESEGVFRGVEIDLVTHDAAKFLRLMLKRNGYVLEQLLSPLVVETSPEHAELRELSARCITRHHAHHYLGFADTQRSLFLKEDPPRVKPLLYVYRVLLTGIHLMRTGRVEANLVHLNEEYRLPYIPDLVARKLGGAEQQTIAAADLDLHGREYARLVARLEEEAARSGLPDEPSCRREIDAFLIRLRLDGRQRA